VARRKLNNRGDEIRGALEILRILCPDPVPLAVETHERAVHIAEPYGYSIFDALIIAAAIHAGAGTLYSEDMRDGQAIEGLTIRNPFTP
jgi:predicted nucleic acid-binding protein